MSSFKVAAVLLLSNLLQIQGSVLAPAVAAPPVAVPAVRYGLVAPQNIRPFAAQVSTYTRGLNVYAAPYAAGVIGGPAIIPVPGAAPAVAPALAPASLYPAVAAPAYPGLAPAVAAAPWAAPAVAAGPWTAPAVAAGPWAAPAVAAAPWAAPAVAATPWASPVVGPAPLLPAPFARSVHAVAPGVPALASPLAAAPWLG